LLININLGCSSLREIHYNFLNDGMRKGIFFF